MSAVVWLHGDSLSIVDPALTAQPTAPALFVFDRPFLSSHRIAFPRLAFMYGGVRDIAAARSAPTDIRVGSVAEELAQFAREHGATELHATENPTPEFGTILTGVRERFPELRVVVHPAERLTTFSGPVTKFFGFWKKVQGEVLSGGDLFRGLDLPPSPESKPQRDHRTRWRK
ncbi:deoxyribodipyrimidine photo-lyase [Deinococcus sp. Arct2-2]|uniref:deoxyribodipyrimidine photo-lyase n=1 Tax=Deinococcus sp. Arct2-2 TaxID=2568653 RepID=UPI0010A397BC|nr:deoxyribodipyrimidine photo-lyase [Deinococcus sp. Arct2-2]THF71456.1 deoxyribodipyrimidine photo-lyase [Deinococcus sp. Arct2-2]